MTLLNADHRAIGVCLSCVAKNHYTKVSIPRAGYRHGRN
ncbi:hypothetical protein LCGC14_3042020, partial [marine sediment metagenome]